MRDLFACTLGIWEIIRLCSGTDANQTDVRFLFFSIVVVFFFGKKRGIRGSDEKNSGMHSGFSGKNTGNTGSDPASRP